MKLNNAIVELKMCQTLPEINLQEAIGMHEFTVVPRALFAADGTMLYCSSRSTLMTVVDRAAIATPSDSIMSLECKKFDIVDGMVAWRCFNPLISRQELPSLLNLSIISVSVFFKNTAIVTNFTLCSIGTTYPSPSKQLHVCGDNVTRNQFLTMLQTRPTSLRFR